MREIQIDNKLNNFIKEFSEDLCSLELLLYFSRHPHARFNRSAVVHASTNRRFDSEQALKTLLEKKIVVSYIENGITLYGLTKTEPMHSLAAELVNIDQRQWQVILGQLLDAQGIQ